MSYVAVFAAVVTFIVGAWAVLARLLLRENTGSRVHFSRIDYLRHKLRARLSSQAPRRTDGTGPAFAPGTVPGPAPHPVTLPGAGPLTPAQAAAFADAMRRPVNGQYRGTQPRFTPADTRADLPASDEPAPWQPRLFQREVQP